MDNQGKIYRRAVPFTQVSNTALRDPNISLKAKGLYALIQSYITIPDFVLYKDYLRRQCKEGESAFDSTFSELRRSGYLIQHKQQGAGGKFVYNYELLDVASSAGEKGKIGESVYAEPYPENPGVDNPPVDKRSVENQGAEYRAADEPVLEEPVPEKPSAGNVRSLEIKNINTDLNNTYVPSFHLSGFAEYILKQHPADRMNDLYDLFEGEAVIRFLQTAGFGSMSESEAENKTREVLAAILSVYEEPEPLMAVGKKRMRTESLQAAMDELTPVQIATVISELSSTPSEVHNIHAYILTSLYRARTTAGSFYNDLKARKQRISMMDAQLFTADIQQND